MKKYYKIISTFSFLGCLCCLFTACPSIFPGDNYTRYMVEWEVYNNTNKNISLYPYASALDPEETKRLYSAYEGEYSDISFTRFVNGSVNPVVELFISDIDEPVRTWRFEDKDQPGKQFFNENSWIKEVKNDGYHIVWTFVIESQDI